MVVGSSVRRAVGLPAGPLPIVATVVFALTVAATIAVAGSSLGYDFSAYHDAAVRVLDGRPVYDLAYDVAGPHGLFLYPPPFVLLVLPFGLLSLPAATGIWVAILLGAFLVGTAILPVPASVRWLIVLLAGLSWPFLYALKLGQVGAILYLAFAVGWRWLERPAALGLMAAAGTIVKLQPALLIPWAALVGRWRAAAIALAVLLALSLVSLAALGVGAWQDFATLITRVSDPIATPQNVTPGAVAYAAGVPREAATAIQWASMAGVVVVLVAGTRLASLEASYLSIVPASQLLSPVLWDHYAMLLLLPVAWLLARRRWWAAIIPLATPVFLVGTIPAVAYPAAFWVTLVAVVWEGRRPSGDRAETVSG